MRMEDCNISINTDLKIPQTGPNICLTISPDWPHTGQDLCLASAQRWPQQEKNVWSPTSKTNFEDEQKSITKKVLNVSIKGDKLKPLETQVAGHGTGDKISHRGMLLHEDGFVLKPAQAPPKGTREIEFYETISKSQHPVHRKLYSLIPKFYGTERLSRDGLNPCQYLVLEDLTQGMIAPCVMDVKIGAKTYGPMATPAKIAQEDSKYLGTKKPLGFSVLGIINRSGENGSMKRYDKSFGMQLATDSVQQMLNVFFNTSSENPDIVAKLVKHFTALLEDVQQFFASQTHYHIYASSILLVYDHCVFAEKDEVRRNRVWSSGEIDKYVRLKIIDFAHVFPAHGQVDHNFLFGLDNLCNLFKRFDCAG